MRNVFKYERLLVKVNLCIYMIGVIILGTGLLFNEFLQRQIALSIGEYVYLYDTSMMVMILLGIFMIMSILKSENNNWVEDNKKKYKKNIPIDTSSCNIKDKENKVKNIRKEYKLKISILYLSLFICLALVFYLSSLATEKYNQEEMLVFLSNFSKGEFSKESIIGFLYLSVKAFSIYALIVGFFLIHNIYKKSEEIKKSIKVKNKFKTYIMPDNDLY